MNKEIEYIPIGYEKSTDIKIIFTAKKERKTIIKTYYVRIKK